MSNTLIIRLVLLLCLPLTATASIRPHQELRDIFYGEILFHAYQQDYFEAISHIDTELTQYYSLDEPALDTFHWHKGQSEFAVGDLELSYRMHQRAGRAIEAVLADNVEPSERNEAAYRLARLYHRKQDHVNAMIAIDRIDGPMPPALVDDEIYLRAQVYANVGKFDESIELLERLRGKSGFVGFVEYNIAMSILQKGERERAFLVLDEFGQSASDNKSVLALRDKANLRLAYYHLDEGDPNLAATYFSRVRLDGPYSNRALLGAGWAEVSQDKFDRALVPWSILHEREQTNLSVQEAMMAVPFAYSKLEVHGKAALMYGKAMDVFGTEIDSLDASIKSVREGKFLEALVDKRAEKDANWVINLRQLPDSPETRYMTELLAAHDFQESLKNFEDLSRLGSYLDTWLDNLEVYEDIIRLRRNYYEPLLPSIEEQFKKLDARIRLRLEQRDRLNDRIQSMLISRRPDYLATAAERSAMDRLRSMKVQLEDAGLTSSESWYRVQRLLGTMQWTVDSEYDDRLTIAYRNLQDLDGIIDDLNKRYRSFVRTRQAATQSYEGYKIPIQQLRQRLKNVKRKLKAGLARQGRVLEKLAIAELDERRKRLEEYQIKARFALAESYDRATAKQEEELLREAAGATPAVQDVPEEASPSPSNETPSQP